MPAFIEAVELRKTYRVGKIDVPALRGISFNVQKGEFVSVVGPSGSGKSTLFYLLGGLTRADSGHVIIDGDDFAQLSDAERTRLRKRKIGFVFQKFNLLPTLDAQSNIDIALDIAGANGTRDATYFDKIVGLLGLDKRLHHRPSELSGGEQQRVALARALINKPAIVLADEPTGNLDSKNSEIVLAMLRHSNRELGQTVLDDHAQSGSRQPMATASFICATGRSWLPTRTRSGPATQTSCKTRRSAKAMAAASRT